MNGTEVLKPLSLSSASGITRSSVTINGSSLLGTTAVKFHGLAAGSFSVNSTGTAITATVPDGASTGPVSVTNPGGATAGPTFTVSFTITSFTPAGRPVGSTVTINGLGFNSSSVVKFNGLAATTHFVSATQLTAVVPSSATTGKISVTNTAAPVGTVYSAATFTKP
jgi:hypothetical protein